jgi:hypothetical protein
LTPAKFNTHFLCNVALLAFVRIITIDCEGLHKAPGDDQPVL